MTQAPLTEQIAERVERPVFFHGEFGLSISFIDQFVQPANGAEAAYLQALSESMEASPGTRTVSLPAGDLVVLNNYFYVHGRAPFERNEQLHRELMRQRGTFARGVAGRLLPRREHEQPLLGLARRAGLEKALAQFPDCVAAAAAQALLPSQGFTAPTDPVAEPWPPMRAPLSETPAEPPKGGN